MAWLSPAYPVGAFSYSSGIEWAVESGDITDAASLRRWLDVVIAKAGARSATPCCSCTRIARRTPTTTRCARSPNSRPPSCPRRNVISKPPRRAAPSSRRRAPRGPAPRSTCSRGLGRAGRLSGRRRCRGAGHGIALEPALSAYLHAVTANLISAGVRLIPLGQTDGQRLLAALEPRSRQPPLVRSQRRSIRSVARRSAPTSPACATKPSTRGCSGRDHIRHRRADPAIPIRDAKS